MTIFIALNYRKAPLSPPKEPSASTVFNNSAPAPAAQNVYTNKITFNYDENKGTVMIGKDQGEMGINFSLASDTAIYVYNSGTYAISVANAGKQPDNKILDTTAYDTGSYAQAVNTGDTFLVKNVFNYCAQGRIDAIQAKGYNSANDLVTFDYVIKPCPAGQHFSSQGASLVQAFGTSAVSAPLAADPFLEEWNGMLQHQQSFMSNPADASFYNHYLAQFDQFRGESFVQMARNVNQRVEAEITYTSDQEDYGVPDYWASPYETAQKGRGDCEDYAFLQYSILQYLGVPEGRLFNAGVDGGGGGGSDHEILLLNIAPDGAPQKFIVLNDGGPVTDAQQYIEVNNLPSGWGHPYVFYDAINNDGYWETPFNTGYQGPAPGIKSGTTETAQSRMKPSVKSQVARINPPAFRRYKA